MLIGILLGTLTALAGNPQLNDPDKPYALQLDLEVGFLAPLSHTIQFGSDGDQLDYVAEGGQNNLFPLLRPTATFLFKGARFAALWQPLDLRTTVSLDDDLQVNALTFPAGRPIDLRYGFSFWRLSWFQRAWQHGGSTLSFGLGLQIRNATISYTAVDGSLSESQRDIGFVPLLSGMWRHEGKGGAWFELQAEGFYAPIRYLNVRDVDVIGAIADIQVRGGLPLADPVDAWLGLRYLGGGASGTGTPEGTGDGYTDNWLHFLALTLGLRLR